jgi:anti-anti-sigma regulatory factor
MSGVAQGILAACTREAVFIRVIGRGACRNSVSLRNFGLQKLQQGYREFYVDLCQCDAMDSTFLGVFAGFGLALGDSGKLILLDLASDKHRGFLDLGLDQIPSVVASPPQTARDSFPSSDAFTMLPGSGPTGGGGRSEEALHQAVVMLEAHEYLCRIDERNESKFRDVTEFLREDLAKHTQTRPTKA